jgi:hypothetical protein
MLYSLSAELFAIKLIKAYESKKEGIIIKLLKRQHHPKYLSPIEKNLILRDNSLALVPYKTLQQNLFIMLA